MLSVRPAMNAPVLNVDYLPIGPARAAIVIFAEEYGGVGMAFGIRSTEGGQVAVFRNREPIDESAPLQDVLEPALASAERMGFLFDEDIVEGRGADGRADAMALWGRLMGDVAMPPSARAVTPNPQDIEPVLDLTDTIASEAELPELILDPSPDDEGKLEVDIDDDLDIDHDIGIVEDWIDSDALDDLSPEPVEPEQPAATSSEKPPPQKLSKFRHVASDPQPAEAEAKVKAEGDPAIEKALADPDSSSHLGRVSLVKVRRGSGDSTGRIPYLVRLLSSF